MKDRNKKKSRKMVVISVIVIIAVALINLASTLRPKATASTEVTPAKGEITTYYSFSGSVEARNRETVLADKMMQVKEIMVESGQVVKKDDVLIKTTSGEKIKAKMDGEISNIYIEKNAQILSGGKLLEIVDYSNLQLKVKVDEYDLSAIVKDKDATVTIHSLGKDVHGKVIEVSKEGIHSNGITFFETIISLDKDEAVRVGMSAEAKVINQSVKDVVTLPMSSIQFDDGNKPYILVKGDKGIGVKGELTLGINDGITVEIKEGVTINDKVLVPKKESSTSFGPGGMPRGDRDSSNAGMTGGN
jgi:multidrug efflux pump subunit AcrA (membrane-fusion protein)